MAEADKKKKADDERIQLRDKDGRLKYRCTADCMYGNEFFARGQIVTFPEEVKVDHRCIEPMYGEPAVNDSAKVYDPNADALKKHDIESARAGIVQR